MPRANGIYTAGNYLRILMMLRAASEVDLPDKTRARALSTSQIARELQKQERPPSRLTVNGYLNDLASVRPQAIERAYSAEGKESHWRLHPYSPLGADNLTEFEAWMVVRVSEVMLPLLPPSMRKYAQYGRDRAARLLEHARGSRAPQRRNPLEQVSVFERAWIEKPPSPDEAVMEAVFSALENGTRLKIRYLTTRRLRQNQPPLEATVSPLRMVVHGDMRLYLLVTGTDNEELLESHDFLDAGYRRLAMHRILQAQPDTAMANAPQDIDTLLADQPGFAWQGRIRLEARIHGGLAMRLKECPLNDSQTLEFDEQGEWHRLSVVVDHNWELRWWVLSHGHAIIVDAPEHFREEIVEHFVRGYQQYTATLAADAAPPGA
jgi:predicted DNA-binding transcriptional regulator YafY